MLLADGMVQSADPFGPFLLVLNIKNDRILKVLN